MNRAVRSFSVPGRLRALAVLAVALAVSTCRDALAPGSVRSGRIAVAPILPSAAALAEFGLIIDAVRFVVVRPQADTLADTTVAFPPGATELALDLRVPLISSPETLSVSVVALSGSVPLFAGTRLVSVPTPLPPPEIAVDTYVGPVADSIVIQPRSPVILLNDSLRFQIQGFNGGVPVTQFYVAWSTSDSAVAAINHFGVLRAPAVRGSVRVRARTPSGASDSVTAVFAPPATQLVVVAGAGQTDTVGQQLPLPLEVEARAADGLGVAGVTVRFRSLTGNGAVTDSVVVTDAAGRARTTAILGGVIGPQSFEASAAGLTGSPVTFGATALAGPPTQLVVTAGDAQLATVATAVATRPSVQLRDAGGNPAAGVSVTFAVASGGGSVTGGSQTTDATGTATVGTWTLGTAAGTNTVTASAAGLTRTFTANGVAGAATQLVRTAGNLQSALVGTAVTTAPAVRAEDQYANPVAGASITFTVGGGGGSVSGATQLTNAAGVASVGGWTLDTLAGANALTATAGGGALSTVFTATGVPAAPSRLLKVLGDSQTAVVNTALTVAPTVRLTDRYGNAIAGDTIDFFVLVDGGFVANPDSATDAGGVASAGAWTLATFVAQNALQAGVRGAAVPPVQFTATGTPDSAAQLLRLSVDSQSALINTAVPTPPAVAVADQYGNRLSGQVVQFVVTDLLGSAVTPPSASTDSTGAVRATSWILGTTAGVNTLEARAGTLTGSPMVFKGLGFASTATAIALNGGDAQTAVVGRLLSVYSVVVTDVAGARVPGVPVAWAVDSLGGTITATSSTDALGVATATRTLGGKAGVQTAFAVVNGLTGSPVRFTATALADTAFRIVKVAGDAQTATVGTLVTTAPSVRVTDAFGNPIAGVQVTFTPDAVSGVVTGALQTTDAAGIATVGGWTLGTSVGAQALMAGAGTLTAVSFTAQATAGAPARLAFLTEPTRSLAGDTIGPAVQVAIQDQFGNINFTAKDVVQLDLGIRANPTAKLVGTTAVAAVNGVATSGDLAVDSAGLGYTLVATSGNLTAAESKPFDVGGVIAAFTFDRWQPVAAAVNPVTSLVYIPGLNNGVGVLDPGKGQVTMVPGFPAPFGVAVNSVTNLIYVTTSQGLVVLNGQGNGTTQPAFVGNDPKGVAVDEGTNRVFVAVAGDPLKGVPPGLALIDGKDNRVIATIPFPDGALAGIGVAFNPNDRMAYVAIPNLGVGVFDPQTAKFVAMISIVGGKGAAGTHGVAVDVRANLVYTTNRAENTFSVIDPVGLKELTRLAVGALPEGLGVDPDRGVAYVANSGNGTVSFIETGKFTVFATLIVGPLPKAAALDPGSGRVYVPTFEDDRVRIVQP